MAALWVAHLVGWKGKMTVAHLVDLKVDSKVDLRDTPSAEL